jgi:PAS domain S-box-containing protein
LGCIAVRPESGGELTPLLPENCVAVTSTEILTEPFALSTDNLPDIVYLVDIEEQRNVFINKSVQTNLGYNEDDIRDMGSDLFPTIIHPDDLPRVGVHYEQLDKVEDGHSAIIEYRVRRKDGVYVWYRSTDTIYERKADGSPKLLLGSAYDITQAKQREETVSLLNRELAHRIQNLFAVNLSLVRIARRRGGDLDTVLDDLEHRIMAMGSVQSQLRQNGQKDTPDLRSLIEDVFSTLAVSDRMELDIADVAITEAQLNSIGIILYELFVASTLRAVSPELARPVQLTATESDGEVTFIWRDLLDSEPFTSKPGQEGMFLLRQAVASIRGEFDLDYTNGQMVATLRFPMARS